MAARSNWPVSPVSRPRHRSFPTALKRVERKTPDRCDVGSPVGLWSSDFPDTWVTRRTDGQHSRVCELYSVDPKSFPQDRQLTVIF